MFMCDLTVDLNGPPATRSGSGATAKMFSSSKIVRFKSGQVSCKEYVAHGVALECRNRAALPQHDACMTTLARNKMDGEYFLAEHDCVVVMLFPSQHRQVLVHAPEVSPVVEPLWFAGRHNHDFSRDAVFLQVGLESVGRDSITSFWTSYILLKEPELVWKCLI